MFTFLKWASMSGLLSHISVSRTTDVWRTPRGMDKVMVIGFRCIRRCKDVDLN